MTTLVSGLNRASDIIIVQENKHPRHTSNPCAEKCNAGALCLLTSSTTRVCSCSMSMTTVLTNNSVTCQASSTCTLNCNSGSCILDERGEATCKCPVLYEGEHCERYRCSGYCRNKGLCYPDHRGKSILSLNTAFISRY